MRHYYSFQRVTHPETRSHPKSRLRALLVASYISALLAFLISLLFSPLAPLSCAGNATEDCCSITTVPFHTHPSIKLGPLESQSQITNTSMSSPTAATRTPQSKSTAGGASKVRGAAAMWENKLATNTDSAKGNSPPKHSNARKPKPLDSNGQRSPSTASSLSPSTPKRGLKANGASSPRNGASSPRNLTPPSSFKADSKPAGRARSGSVSAKAASPPVRSSSPPPLPQMPAVLKQESKSEAGEDDSIYSDKAGIDLEDGVVEGDSIAKAAEPSVLSPEVDSAAPPMDEAELNDAMLDVMLEDAKLDSVNLDELQLDDVQLDTVQLDDKPQMNGERSSAPLDFSLPAEDVPQSPVAVAAKSPTLSTGSPHLPDPVPVVTLADPIPTPIAKDHGDVHKAELDVTDLPRRSTSRPRTPPAGGLSPGTPENASPTPTTPARSGLQSIFGRMMPASSPVTPAKDLDADINDAKSDDSAIKDRSATAPGKSFFSSATSAFNSIQLPSVSLPSLPAASSSRSNSQLTPPTESPAVFQNLASPPHSATMAGSSWRTTMSSFLQRSTSPQPPTAPLPTRNGSTSGAALLTKRFESPTASRDRRISHEAGGSTQLREGFERVRNEMEGAARDIRRERAGRGESVDGDVDWAFWGSVVQDYEEVARTRPKDLSRAIQQGIPAVIRGPIWQLMSSSKSLDLEETYKALLKLPSPHEKAIQKDITRTFPDHKFFQGVGAGQDGLFMVVKAYSLYDVEVGYTQGLAFVVASLLLNVGMICPR